MLFPVADRFSFL